MTFDGINTWLLARARGYLLFAAVTCWLHTGASADTWIDETVVSTRTPIASNTSAHLFRELRDPVVIAGLSNVDIQVSPGVVVLFGGDDIHYAFVFRFFDEARADRIATMARVMAYVELRWRGISSETALEIVTSKAASKSALSDEEVMALRERHPFMPVDRLQPVSASELAFLPMFEGKKLYLFVDTTIAWVVSFRQVGAQLSCIPYAVDVTAFKPKVATTLKRVIPSAMKASRKQWGRNWRLGLFWHALKDALLREGITWQTPTELNPQIAW